MNPVEFSLRKPVTLLVGVLFVVLFGVLALLRLPVQLTPNVDLPVISVATHWEGASPQEIETEVVEEQEEQLKSVQGLREMTSTSVQDNATVTLEFHVGVDISRALLDVSDRLRQVPSYPEGVEEPVVRAGETQGTGAIAWFSLMPLAAEDTRSEDTPFQRTLVEERVKPRLERVAGIASIGIFGGFEREVHVRLDPHKLAARELTLLDVRDAVRSRNVDVSAGDLDQGKRSYTIRTVGKFSRLADLEDVVLARRDGRTVHLGDVAEVTFGFKEADRRVRSRGQPTIAINAQREAGSNVIQVMHGIREAVAEMNAGLLRDRGLQLVQTYDETDYIQSAIDLVLQNLYVGGTLTVLVLWLFLRHVRSVLVVTLSIPVSVIGSFLALAALGRNLNVVSLAGLAFAVGMVVDNSIVVLENIVRHRQQGKGAFQAALGGAREVWGAVLASTLTTVAVFVPVLFVREEAGQLFQDIAIAISASVFLSLVVAVLFIPMMAARLVHGVRVRDVEDTEVTGRIARLVGRLVRRPLYCFLTVGVLTAASLFLSWLLLPPMSYLPEGNRNLVFGFMIPPPGYSMSEFERIGREVEETLAPYWEQAGAIPPELQFPDWYDGTRPIPGIRNFFYVASGNNVFMGALSEDDQNVQPLIPLLNHSVASIPGVMLFASQSSLFARSISSGNSLDVEVQSDDFVLLQGVAQDLTGRIAQALAWPRPDPPNFDLGAPEIRLLPDGEHAAELGLSVAELGFMVSAMVDGAIVSDFRDEGVTLDVKITPVMPEAELLERLGEVPLYTPAGRSLPLSELVRVRAAQAPSQIRHLEERRSVRLAVNPPPGMELSRAMDVLQDDILAPMRAQGALPPTVDVLLSGTADKLVSTRRSLQWNFVLAVIISYLLMSALFESFVYPFVILFSVPLAAVGGIGGLRIVHQSTGQQLDVLTMLGFVILVGTVVNNAILIVHQALLNLREAGDSPVHAIARSVQSRVRPIFMSTMTSVFGMTPLVLFPGSGSELYRGLGSVVVGGLLVSTVFSLLVIPTLLRLVLAGEARLRGVVARFRDAGERKVAAPARGS